jgi:hypothetical protein
LFSYTLLADLKNKFDLYMRFQYPGESCSWDEQFPDACLRKAAAHHEYDPGWKITNHETFNQCVKCGKDATKTYDQTVESGTSLSVEGPRRLTASSTSACWVSTIS